MSASIPRPLIDYHPSVRDILRRSRKHRIRNAVIDFLAAVAVVIALFGAIEITEAIVRYAIAIERNATLETEVAELRSRVDEADAWECRDFRRTYNGHLHRWCTREIH